MYQDSPLSSYIHDLSAPTKRGHERCIALIESATALFLKQGYDAVSLDDIVNHAGGSKTTIYKYFGNKEGLFVAICDYHRELFFKGVCVAFNPTCEELRNYLINTLINFYQHILDPDHTAFMRIVIEQSQRNPELAAYLYNKGTQLVQNTIANALIRAAEQGNIVCCEPLYSAMYYLGILRNWEWQVVMGLNPQLCEQEILKYIEYAVDLFLAAHQKV
ncbi:TetR family transcriptional regulator [Acinetobacter sp. ANC 4558]|uniref:TetR/AcrR family transcriptional regulator n=1 Tax=Acinetobacter sp. ANC 4558 TaxID=1977876 RepID=UPI000A346397|nr:TetR/AcrR family transcriptional regulator [Acinetobacter sp. ANC 4558]OTG80761.1 TetR family transcriptional regulator [Acinetobacter sp. ANC 4558]